VPSQQRYALINSGWGDDGQPAKIAERIGDVFIRNVTADIRRAPPDDRLTYCAGWRT
jgi:hypothetical protein